MSGFNPQKLLRQKEIVIPFAHLPSQLKQAIKSMNQTRSARAIVEVAAGIFGALAIRGALIREWDIASGMSFVTGTGFGIRQTDVVKIQNAHQDIVKRGKPIIRSDVENQYPRDWIQLSEIIKTHPIFYIRKGGSLVLVKNSRAEYYRYLYQKSPLGKAGLNTWWWRGYLEPPTAPEPVKKWAQKKLHEAVEKYRERKAQKRRAFRPASVPVHSNRKPLRRR